jgi:hypothetical protein
MTNLPLRATPTSLLRRPTVTTCRRAAVDAASEDETDDRHTTIQSDIRRVRIPALYG